MNQRQGEAENEYQPGDRLRAHDRQPPTCGRKTRPRVSSSRRADENSPEPISARTTASTRTTLPATTASAGLERNMNLLPIYPV